MTNRYISPIIMTVKLSSNTQLLVGTTVTTKDTINKSHNSGNRYDDDDSGDEQY